MRTSCFRLYALTLASGLFFFVVSAQAQQESILDFHSLIEIAPDASLTVTETIRVFAAGDKINHGIYRDFPTIYSNHLGARQRVGFNLVSMERDGQPEPHHFASLVNGIRIYAGSRDVAVPTGEHTYILTYKTDRQIGFFENFDELYWNVTGNGWDFPILAASATIELPPGATVMSTDGYTGPQGAKEKNFSASTDFTGRPNFQTTRLLAPREGFTIVVSWPKGFVQKPTPTKEAEYVVQDNQEMLAGVFGLLLIFIYYIAVWYQHGRDPKKGVIIPLFHPPADLCPSSIRMIRQMEFDNKVFTAAILNMAVKGYLKIEEHSAGAIANIFGGKTYSLKKTGENKESLSLEEFAMADVLFGPDETIELKNENNEIIRLAIKALQAKLSGKLEKIYFLTNSGYFVFGAFLSGLVGFFVAARMSGLGWLVFAAWGLIILMNIIFVRLLKAPTLQGRKIMDQIEGFRMFLSVTEKDRLNLMNPPEKTPELFEKYLPYALALNVDQAWAEQFSEVLKRATETTQYHPAWYVGGSWTHFEPRSFSSSLNNSFASAIAAAATPPGSSSGGGGGGFSGGGGGGGGGGGW